LIIAAIWEIYKGFLHVGVKRPGDIVSQVTIPSMSKIELGGRKMPKRDTNFMSL
jgi:hypothetical protein